MTNAANAPGIRAEPAERCPLCGGNGEYAHRELRDELFGAPGQWAVRRCNVCHSLWLDPRPTLEDLHLAYRTYYTHNSAHGTTTQAGTEPADRMRRLAHRVPGHGADGIGALGYLGGAPGSVLDVGCGDGCNARALERAHWRVTAIDIDAESIAAARAAGCRDARVATIDELDEPAGSFDAVVSIHSIEHVPDPASMLRRARELLRPGGTVSIVTPNAESWFARQHGAEWRGLEPPRHLQVFSSGALRTLLTEAGYESVEVRTTQRGAKGMVMARRQTRQRRQNLLGMVLAQAEGELWQLAETALLRRQPTAGEELVGTATAP